MGTKPSGRSTARSAKWPSTRPRSCKLTTAHKTMLEAKSGNGAIESFPRVGGSKGKKPPSESAGGLRDKTFRCHICDVHVNSDTQLKQHISSRRHKDRAAGKVTKPKFKPYVAGQRLHTSQPKNHDQLKPPLTLASSLLHGQLAATMSSLPPFSLHLATNASLTLFRVPPPTRAVMHQPLVLPHY
ncbi:zinc finger protein 385D-like isoform X2 [Hippocampus comes]|uniref:zinc finger protein 385D-like isoform X2 n=1 Tax=Hippocampus comes TaxID=109280 RepID=UPI00094ECCBF|nr:PREDICTED: zinc finger protein 385D-like isoform X2 [Hippocampus comes]XP_019751507.1 PREDICTED: zinc finger protein 385D-like isoform X2 [Hippocampus comes]